MKDSHYLTQMNLRLIFLFSIICSAVACSRNTGDDKHLSAKLSPVIAVEDSKTADPSWSTSNTLVYHCISEPDNLHPTNGNSTPRSEILMNTQQPLLRVDFQTQQVIPCLVKSIPVPDENNLRYKYELLSNARWDDGTSLSSEDVIFTAKVSRCALTNNPGTKMYWKNLKSILSDPGSTSVFTLIMKTHNIQNLSFLTSFSVMERKFHDPKNILGKYSFEQMDDSSFHAEEHKDLVDFINTFNDDKYGRDPDFLNGLGPYKVESWDAGQSITLVRKTNYWGSDSKEYFLQAFPEKIIYKLNKDENSTQLEFKKQTFDASTNFSTSSLIALKQDPAFNSNYNSALTLTYNYTYVGFNEHPETVQRPEIFTDPITRKALAYLTPVDQLIRLVYKDYSKDCKRMISNVSPLKEEFNKDLKAIPYDVEEGKKLLTEGGWKDSNGDGILDKIVQGKNTSFSVDLMFLSTASDWKDMATLLAQEYAKSGIEVRLVPADLKSFSEKARAHDYDIILGSWGATSLPEDYSQIWHTASWKNHGMNYTCFGNEASDALIDSIKTESQNTKRIEMVKRLQSIIYEDQPCVFLYCSLRRVVVHKRFGNLKMYAERPGILLNTLHLLSENSGVATVDNPSPH